MIVSVSPSIPAGKIKAIASKSVAHRLLICAALGDKRTVIRCEQTNKDIEATAVCLSALGAKIVRNAPFYEVEPITKVKKGALLPCGESGSTLRFLIPVTSALGADASFLMEGRLPERPLSPLREELEAHGIRFSYEKSNILKVEGQLSGDKFSIDGSVSSQFISGLLFALSLLPYDATLTVTGKIGSAPYINITEDALALFGARPKKDGNTYTVTSRSPFTSPNEICVEGDWSNAAFPLCIGILGKGSVCVTGLNSDSSQGDSKIIELIRRFGGELSETADGYVASPSSLCGIDIDAEDIPDLVPVLAVLASVAKGKTKIYRAARLRIKESDRLESVCAMLTALGADIKETDDGLIINGKESLTGGRISSCNDHRIAMSAAVASCACSSPVIIEGAEAVEKSYPSFWEDMLALGIICDNVN